MDPEYGHKSPGGVCLASDGSAVVRELGPDAEVIIG